MSDDSASGDASWFVVLVLVVGLLNADLLVEMVLFPVVLLKMVGTTVFTVESV